MRPSTLAVPLLLLPPALLAQRVPEIEPNDTPALAQPVTVGTQVDANLLAGEQDWYSFTLATATRIRIHTTNADTRIALCDAAGTTYLAIDDDGRTGSNGFASDITLNIAAGSYTIQVVGFTSTTTGLYSLDLAQITPVVYDGVEIEPNDTFATATPTGVLGSGAMRFQGNLGPDTMVFSDSAAAPAVPPVVLSSQAAPSAIVFSGSVPAFPISTPTLIETHPGQPMSNPPLATYVPGMSVLFTSGANLGLSRSISTNTGFTITVTDFPVAPLGSDTYDIVTTDTTTVTWVPSLPLADLYTGGGYDMRMTSGANVGLSRLISANSGPSPFGSELTVATAWPVANAPGDTFDIDCIGSTAVFRTTSPLAPGAWNPTTGGLSLGHYNVRFTSGANNGLVRQISGNTMASITLGTALTAAPAASDTFVVEQCDADYWRIVLTAPYTGIWFQINEGDAPWVFGHQYELYDALGNALLPDTSLELPAFGTQSAACNTLAARTSSARVWPAGTYYIAVRNPVTPVAARSVMPSGTVPTGNYLLEIFTMPMDTGTVVTETEPAGGPNANNTAATATPIAPGQVGRGNVTSATGSDPTDWWGPIAITGPSTITVQTRRNATSAAPLLDSTINLRDGAGNLLLTATGGNVLDVPSTSVNGLHGRVTVSFFVPFPAVYVEVASPGTAAGMSGDYELEISSVIPAPYVTASYTTTAANAACGVPPFPALTRQFTGEVPALGSTFSRQLTGCLPAAAFFLMQGLSNTAANGGATPLPFDLVSLGAPGCTINVDPLAITLGVADGAGMAELSLQLSEDISFRGFYWYEQALVLNPAANALGVQVSNYARPVFGERSY